MNFIIDKGVIVISLAIGIEQRGIKVTESTFEKAAVDR
jgi:hypothetical protein